MDTGTRDRARLRAYGMVLRELGLTAEAMDGKGPAERERIVREAIGALRRTDEQKALGLGEQVTLGGRDVTIRPLPAAAAAEYRERVIATQKECFEKSQPIDTIADPMKQTMAMLELEDLRMRKQRELAERYLGQVPEDATDQELGRAVDLMNALAFPFLAALSQAAQAQITGS